MNAQKVLAVLKRLKMKVPENLPEANALIEPNSVHISNNGSLNRMKWT
jgi:hypothetical protein